MPSLLCFLCFLCSVPVLLGAEHRDVGLTQKGNRIEASVFPGASSTSPTVLLIGGLAGDNETARLVTREIQTFEAIRQDQRRFRLLAISIANPDSARLQFPPAGVAYRENSESHALWRWIGTSRGMRT